MRRLSPKWAKFEQVDMEPTSSIHMLHARRGRGFVLNLHYHPAMELTLIPRGRGMRFVGDSVHPFEEGDLCLVGANLLHSWYTGEEPMATESIVIQFDPELLTAMGKQFPELRRLPELITRGARGLAYFGAVQREVGNLMRQASAATPSSIHRFSIILRIFESLLNASDPEPISAATALPAQPNPTLSRFQQVMNVLHHQMPHAPDQAEMAQRAKMTPAAFSRFFRRMVGRSYVEYVNAWRISLACRQLIQSTHPITRIAFDCGFANLSNFNRRFQQYKQMTPSHYRDMVTTSRG